MSPRPAAQPPRPWGDLAYPLVLLALCGLLFFGLLGQRSLWETDEARYGEIAREMVQSGDWVTPRLNYVKYFEKPILTYWLVAGSFKIFGISDWSARITPALFATLTVLLVYLLGRSLWEARSGFMAALCLATSLMFMALSWVLIVDMVLCFGVVLAVYGAWELRLGRRWGGYLFWMGCAVGFLTKGLLGPGLPAMAVVLFALLGREWALLRRLADWRGALLFLVLVAPWNILVSLANPEYPAYFLHENVGRLVAGQEFKRHQPFWYYLPLLPAGFLPWVAFLPWGLKQTWPGKAWLATPNRPWLLPAVWLGSFLLFLSAGSSKMMHYALPMLPPLALLMGRPLAALLIRPLADLRQEAAPPGVRWGVTALAACAVAAACGLPLVPALSPDIGYDQVGAFLLIGPLLLAGLGLGLYAIRGRAWAGLAAPLLVAAGVVLCVSLAAPRLEEYRSVKQLAAILKGRLAAEDVLVSFGDYFQGLPLYTGRRVVVAGNWGELEFGRARDPQAAQWFLPGPGELMALMRDSRRRVVVLCFSDEYARFQERFKNVEGFKHYPWASVGDKVLFANRPL
ncbi:MAG: glycosyltransferase family 39 protein [Desulfarculus sp.]|nr:glycosyltransferase family 39 protein [Desulfarculus sp.]